MSARRNQERNGPPGLRAPRDEALAALERQLAEGSELLQVTRVSSPQEFEGFRLRVNQWRDGTTERLRRMFDQDEYATRFSSTARPMSIVPSVRVGGAWGLATNEFEQMHRHLREAFGLLETYRNLVRDEVVAFAPAPQPVAVESRIRDVYFHIDGGAAVGQVNIGAAVQNIQGHINALAGLNADDAARAFKELTEAAVSDDSLDDRARTELIEHYEDLSEQAAAPPERRWHSRITAALERLPALLQAATKAREAWDQWGPTIEGIFRHK